MSVQSTNQRNRRAFCRDPLPDSFWGKVLPSASVFSPTKWEPDSPLTMSRGWSLFLTLMHSSNTKSFLTELWWHSVRTPVECLLHASHQARCCRERAASVMGLVPEHLSLGRKVSVCLYSHRGLSCWAAQCGQLERAWCPRGILYMLVLCPLPQSRSWNPRSYLS